jgi:hypothetical protein
MRTRRLPRVLALAILALLVAGIAALWPGSDQITRDNFKRIHRGMTRDDVRAILGPPGDRTTLPTEPAPVFEVLFVDGPLTDNDASEWTGNAGWIQLDFDARGKVIQGQLIGQAPLKLGMLDLLLWRIERQWNHWFADP